MNKPEALETVYNIKENITNTIQDHKIEYYTISEVTKGNSKYVEMSLSIKVKE